MFEPNRTVFRDVLPRPEAAPASPGRVPSPGNRAAPSVVKSAMLRMGITWTRHPGTGAVEEPKVPLREPQWNERPTATRREKAGVYTLLWVNVN
jgi:hypothetical protein